MVQLRLTSTKTSDFSPLGSAWQRSYELIRREVAKLGPRYEALFAEPFPSPQGDSIDWYAIARGKMLLVDDLPEEERDAAWADFNALLSNVAEHGQRLARSSDPEQRRLGEALSQATTYPDTQSVYLVGDQPVVICWAHRSSSGKVPRGALINKEAPTKVLSPAAEPDAAPPFSTALAVDQRPASRWSWLWWLLWGATGAMALVIAWLVIPACGLSAVSWLNFCPAPAQASIVDHLRDRDVQLNRIERLERELRLAELSCRPQQATLPERPADEFDRRIEREGGDTDAQYKITLIWDSQNDLDLDMRCPNGKRLYFNDKKQCGAALNLDRNTNTTIVPEPVENIVFKGVPAPGTYVVGVRNYRNREATSNAYKLRIQKGTDVQTITGNVPRPGMKDEYPIEFP